MAQFEIEITDLPPSARTAVCSWGPPSPPATTSRWIEEAKREETRRARIEKAAAMLAERVRHP